MARIYALGESLLDIIIKDGKQIKTLPGGSVVNAAISLGRLKLPVYLLSEYGTDEHGKQLEQALLYNNVNTDFVYRHNTGKTALAYAYLNDQNEATYEFHKNVPEKRLAIKHLRFTNDDILIFGSWFGIDPEIRKEVKNIVTLAKDTGTIIIYDPNYRKMFLRELPNLKSAVLDNFMIADLIRGSDEDFQNIFATTTFKKACEEIRKYNAGLIYTASRKGVYLNFNEITEYYQVPELKPLSTIGAGDNFNAGLIYGLHMKRITKHQLEYLKKQEWKDLVETAIRFATNVCMSEENYISPDFARIIKEERLKP